MKKELLICATLLATLTNCSSSDNPTPPPDEGTNISILAQLPDITTKISFTPNDQSDKGLIAGWQASDVINVYAINGGSSAKRLLGVCLIR